MFRVTQTRVPTTACHEGNLERTVVYNKPPRMQVKANPKQDDGFNCGIFTGLAAEVFSLHAKGRFSVTKLPVCDQLHCEGEHPSFLMKKDTWWTAGDVRLARILAQAAAVAYFKWSYTGKLQIIEQLWEESRDRLVQKMPAVTYTSLSLWYGCSSTESALVLHFVPPLPSTFPM